ncbi:U11/U12 small nuclear ribonucleoprotein 35 kDa protein-like protein, partial [Leptotrombidium deliense]
MSEKKVFKAIVDEYDPVKVGSIDGSDTTAHDKAIVRAINSDY